MAIAAEALPGAAEAAEGGEAGASAERARVAPAPRPGSSGGDWLNTGRGAYSRVSTPGATAQTITKLIWAVAVGLIVLEIAAQATGQTWAFNLPGIGRGPAPKLPYQPLYPGQDVGAAMPGVLAGAPGPSTNAAGRAGGNRNLG